MPTMEFYLERAADARREADDAPLANVRDRCLSAAMAWDSMADRLRRTQEFRDAHEAARASASATAAALNSRQEDESEHSTSIQGAAGAASDLSPAAP